MPLNPFQNLRMNSIFGTGQSRPGSMENYQIPYERAQVNNTDDNEDIGGMINNIYTPSHQMSDRYMEEYDKRPKRTEPGKLKRIFGFMAGLGEGGAKAQDQVKYGKYYRDMDDYQNNIKLLQPGMLAERNENTNERILAHQTSSDILRQRDIKRKETKDQADIDLRNRDSDTRRMRAEAYINNINFKQKNPTAQLVKDEDGEYYWSRPGEDPIKAGVNGLSELEEIELNGKRAERLEAIRQRNRTSLEETKQSNRLETKRTPSATKGDDGSVDETTTEVTIEKDKDGNPIKKITKQSKVKRPGTQTSVRMMTPDGKRIVMVPPDKVKEAESKGGKRVK